MRLFKLIQKSVFIILSVISSLCYAQEQLRPLSSNINLPPIPESTTINKKIAAATPLNLPFFDDFSYAYKSPYPSANNWLDSNAYVNMGFAINPITLGVATFDGLNKKGYPYNINVAVNYSGIADILTSWAINLHSTNTHTYSPVDSIFLTFYYQAQGFGEAPEATDSLCVDFWKPNQQKWKKVWGVKGYNPSASDTGFYRVRVPIADTAYCDSLFKFRFRNKATISGSLDHWNVDYVQIKMLYGYADTINDDVAFAYKPTSFLKNYSVMPYRQYDQALELATGFKNYIRNNFNSTQFSTYDYRVKDALGNAIPSPSVYPSTFIAGVAPYLPNGGYYTGNEAHPVFGTNYPFIPPFATPNSTFFVIKHIVTTSSDLHRENDTLVHVQKFDNYYAYDDASAEQGYYLNNYGAKLAARFTLNVLDTLKAVRIYFDPIIEGTIVQQSSFRLLIWGSSGGSPAAVIYKDSLMYPTYIQGSHNLFPIYNLTTCLPLGVGTYFVGIQQTTNKGLNIGFDKNTNHKDALYYDISGTWEQSTIPGSIMINPVMGCADLPIGISELEKNDKIKLFPNPAQNSLTISYPGNQLGNANLEIISALGQTVFTKSIISNEQIDISNISDGLYFIYLRGNNLNVSPKKLIISR